MQNDWLVYLWSYPDGRPLYVGIGRRRSIKRQRWDDHRFGSSNRRLYYTLNKYEHCTVAVLHDGISKEEAAAIEITLIKTIGRRDLGTGSLLNLTDGGDGRAGYVETLEQKTKRVAAMTLAHKNPETKRKHVEAMRAAWRRYTKEEIRIRNQKISESQRGRIKSEVTRRKLSTSHQGVPNVKARGKIRTTEQRARIAEGTRAAMALLPEDTKMRMKQSTSRPETRAKMSASALARLDTQEKRNVSAARLNTPSAVAKRYTESRAAAISVGQKKSWSDPEIRARRVASIKAASIPRKWITNGVSSQRLPVDEPIPDGWRLGRVFASKRVLVA